MQTYVHLPRCLFLLFYLHTTAAVWYNKQINNFKVQKEFFSLVMCHRSPSIGQCPAIGTHGPLWPLFPPTSRCLGRCLWRAFGTRSPGRADNGRSVSAAEGTGQLRRRTQTLNWIRRSASSTACPPAVITQLMPAGVSIRGAMGGRDPCRNFVRGVCVRAKDP